MRLSEIDRFWSKVAKRGVDDCWIWLSYTRNGYGRFWVIDHDVTAHRYSFELIHGKISNDMKVCHKCDVTWCVNPSHLFLGTQNDNVQDMHKKKRAPDTRGEKHRGAKLNNEKVIEIRKLTTLGNTSKELAVKYGVSRYTIYDVLSKKRWGHLL